MPGGTLEIQGRPMIPPCEIHPPRCLHQVTHWPGVINALALSFIEALN